MRKLKFILSCLFLGLINFGLNAQITVVNDGILTIKEGQIVHIEGSLSNYSSQFSNQGDIGLTGNFLNEFRVKNPERGIFRFIGMQEQILTMYDTLDLFNVEIDNPAGLVLDGITHLQVFGNMNFRDGIVETNEDIMLSFKNGATTSNGSYYSHINGPAMKSGSNNFVFPMGKEGDYRPASISDMSASSTFKMEYIHFPYFNFTREFEILKVNDEGYWDFQKLEGEADPRLSLSYDEATNIFDETDKLEIVQWDDTWEILPSVSDGASPVIGLTTQNQLSKYGFFTTGQRRVAIPDISSIIITQNEFCEIIIDWTMPPRTLIETYEIEYSYDSLDFVYTGEVEGSLEMLTSFRTFQFVDKNLHEASKVYYRLKLIAPGPWPPVAYSEVIAIENNCIYEDSKIYPNPLLSSQNLNFQVRSNVATEMPLQIWNALGRLVFEQTLNLVEGSHVYEINTKENNMPSGTYFLKINPRESLKFIVLTD